MMQIPIGIPFAHHLIQFLHEPIACNVIVGFVRLHRNSSLIWRLMVFNAISMKSYEKKLRILKRSKSSVPIVRFDSDKNQQNRIVHKMH